MYLKYYIDINIQIIILILKFLYWYSNYYIDINIKIILILIFEFWY